VSSHQSPDRPEPRKSGIHDADLDGLAIRRPAPGESSPAGRSRWIWLTLAVLLVAAGLAWSSAWLRPDQRAEVVPVIRMPSGSGAGLAATGYVVAQRQASIASKGTGRLIYFGVNVGDRVKAGQLIARIEHDDMDALYRQALARFGLAGEARQGEDG
jgi:multidrug efflux pump subunit AcrA (membrane-fusion protein)